MRNWILGGLLACVSSAGVAYVLARNSNASHCGPCIEKPAVVETAQKEPLLGRCDAYDPPSESSCPNCKPSKSNDVVDVVDLNNSFRMADGSPKPKVSFEEPPLAKPRGEVMPVKFEVPAAVEVLPMPREATPEAIPEASFWKKGWFLPGLGFYLGTEVAPMPREAVNTK